MENINLIDLGEAAALYTIGFPLLEVKDSEQGTFKEFIFEEMDTHIGFSKDVIDAYRKDKLDVNARKHFQCIKDLKSRIYELNQARSTN